MSKKYTLTLNESQMRDLLHSLVLSSFFLYRFSGQAAPTDMHKRVTELEKLVVSVVEAYGSAADMLNPTNASQDMVTVIGNAGMIIERLKDTLDSGLKHAGPIEQQPKSIQELYAFVQSVLAKSGTTSALNTAGKPTEISDVMSDPVVQEIIQKTMSKFPGMSITGVTTISLDELLSLGPEALSDKFKSMVHPPGSPPKSLVTGGTSGGDKLKNLLKKLKGAGPAASSKIEQDIFSAVLPPSPVEPPPPPPAGFNDSISEEIAKLLAKQLELPPGS